MRNLDDLFAELSTSSFRRRFHLRPKELQYLQNKGMATILEHAAHFVRQRLAPANPPNDGKQTPWGNHPVFVAQHATGTCCRGCLKRWHHIPSDRPLTEEEQHYVVSVIHQWLNTEVTMQSLTPDPHSR